MSGLFLCKPHRRETALESTNLNIPKIISKEKYLSLEKSRKKFVKNCGKNKISKKGQRIEKLLKVTLMRN